MAVPGSNGVARRHRHRPVYRRHREREKPAAERVSERYRRGLVARDTRNPPLIVSFAERNFSRVSGTFAVLPSRISRTVVSRTSTYPRRKRRKEIHDTIPHRLLRIVLRVPSERTLVTPTLVSVSLYPAGLYACDTKIFQRTGEKLGDSRVKEGKEEGGRERSCYVVGF